MITEKREAYSIILCDAQAYIMTYQSDGLIDTLEWTTEKFTIDGNILNKFINELVGVESPYISIHMKDSAKTYREYINFDIERTMRNLYEDSKTMKVSNLFITIPASNLCEIEVHIKSDDPNIEGWIDQFTYSGKFIIGWK